MFHFLKLEENLFKKVMEFKLTNFLSFILSFLFLCPNFDFFYQINKNE